MSRVILHIDMDAFYAAIEQRDHPELRGKPVVVGAPPDKRGVVSAASYEARKFGIHSAMPSRVAYSRCPQAVFLPVNFQRYEEVSAEIMQCLHEVTDQVEPLSLDEAFLDVSDKVKTFDEGVKLASRIKENIYKRTKLTCSVGVAPNKFLAKIASDLKKPNGFVVVREEQRVVFLRPLPVRKIWGVGPVTEQLLKDKGLETIGDIQRCTLEELTAKIGSLAASLYYLARGEDESPVVTERVPKQISRETTFEKDVSDPAVLTKMLEELSVDVARNLKEERLKGRTVTLKIRYSNFETHTRQTTLKNYVAEEKTLCKVGKKLLDQYLEPTRPVRLIGLGVSNFSFPTKPESTQLELFPSPF